LPINNLKQWLQEVADKYEQLPEVVALELFSLVNGNIDASEISDFRDVSHISKKTFADSFRDMERDPNVSAFFT
jgi:hypothetical protein